MMSEYEKPPPSGASRPERDFRYSLLCDENTRLFLKLFIGLILASVVLYISAVALSGESLFRSTGALVALVSSAGALALYRRGRIGGAAQILVWGTWLSLMLQIFISNGLSSRSMMALPITIMLAGWLLPPRSTLMLCLASLLAGVVLALGEQRGLLPLRSSPSPPLLVWLAYSIFIGLAAVLAYFVFRGFRLRDETMRGLGDDLAAQVDTLTAREAELRLVMESVPVMLFHGDRDQRCLYANRKYADFYAVDQERLQGLGVREIIGAETYDAFDVGTTLGRALAGERFSYRTERRASNGEARVIDISMIPEPDGQGGTRGFFSLFRDVTEEVRAEEALRRSEEKFASVFRSSPFAVAITRLADGRYLDVNEAFVRLFGWQREEAIGRTSLELGKWTTPEARAAWAATLRQTGHVSNLETDFRTRSGEVRRVLLSAERIDMSGEPCALVMTADITERKQAEKALHDSEERLRLATAGGGVGIWEWDIASGALAWNDQLKRIFGLPADAAGLTLDGFVAAIHPEDGDRVQCGFRAALEQHAEFDSEYRIVRPDGSVSWIIARGHGVYDGAGQAMRMVGMAIDTTERKRAEEKFAKIFHASPVAISISRLSDGFYLDVNQAIVEQFGWSRDEFIGRTALAVGVWPSREERDRWVAELRLAGRVRNFETRLNTKSGEQRNVIISAEKIILDGEECAIGLVHDITEQTQAKTEIQRLNDELETRVRERTAELQAANKELESLAYSISHDLRAPLRGIDGFSHLLAEEYGKQLDAQGKGYLERVRAAAQRMGTLIDDILELSRVTRHSMRRSQVDLSRLAKEILEEQVHSAPERAVEVAIAADCAAFGDPQLLRVMLQNLLENAWKYSGKEVAPRIEFGRETQDGEQAFFVRDNGVGFDMKYADRLFAPFQRLHRPEEFAGTGIGLATVARIVHRHGGRVWAESAPGQGTTLRFTLGPSSAKGQ